MTVRVSSSTGGERDLEAVVREALDQTGTPLDDRHRIRERRLEIQVRDLGQRAER